MFSKACEYAIRAAIYISANSDTDHKVGIDAICQQIEAPKHFTAKILQALSRKRIISSQKGVNGGFYMDKKQSAKMLIEIVDAVDGDSIFTGCGLGLKECSETEPCPLHNSFKSIRNDLKTMLSSSSIDALAKNLTDGSGFLKAQ